MEKETITIDSEFRSLIPPLTEEERTVLAESLRREGCRDALVTWNGLLLDGHTRKKICERYHLKYSTIAKDFKNRDEAKAWIITNQFGRRNLQLYQRAELALKLAPLIAKKAKHNIRANQNNESASAFQKSDKQVHTSKEVAKIAGVSHDTIHKVRVIAEKAPKEVQEKLRRGDPSISIHKAYTAIQIQEREDAKKTTLQACVEIVARGLTVADFREGSSELPDECAELVFTDPPYDRDSIPLYEDMERIAWRILKSGGSLITYCGQVILPDVIRVMGGHLRYLWLNACVFEKTFLTTQLRGYGIANGWKPLLWFVKGTRGDVRTFVSDVVSGGKEKSRHEWQQAESEAAYYIAKLTSPHGLVVDFFAGSGTTCVAAQKLGRSWVAYEVNPVTARTADERLRGVRA